MIVLIHQHAKRRFIEDWKVFVCIRDLVWSQDKAGHIMVALSIISYYA